MSTETGRAYPQQCKSWRCRHCAKIKRAAIAIRIERGLEAAAVAGKRVRLVTLTAPADSDMGAAELSQAWERLQGRLRYRGLLGQFFGTTEPQDRGALHLHVLFVDSERGGGFIPQALLSQLAEASGFGPIVDIRLVEPAGEAGRSVAEYLTKGGVSEAASALAAYMTKAGAESLADKSAKRVRPERVSNGWPGGKQRELEAEIRAHFKQVAIDAGAEPDEGPFEPFTEAELAQLLDLLERGLQLPRDVDDDDVAIGWLLVDDTAPRGPPTPLVRSVRAARPSLTRRRSAPPGFDHQAELRSRIDSEPPSS